MTLELDGIVRIRKHPETGASYTKTKSDADNYSYLVDSSAMEWGMNPNTKQTTQGPKHRVAFVTIVGGLEYAKILEERGDLADGKELPGKIVLCEQLLPFKDENYNIKINPETKQEMMIGTHKIYWKYQYDPFGTMQDETVMQWVNRMGFVIET
jgi:hypothetical protein